MRKGDSWYYTYVYVCVYMLYVAYVVCTTVEKDEKKKKM